MASLIGMEIKVNTALARDAPERFKKLMVKAVQRVVESGEQMLDERFRPRPAGVYLSVGEAKRGAASTGHYRRNIQGQASQLQGRIHDSRVIYGPWLEGVGSRNAVTRFKGYHVWRNVRQDLQIEARAIAKKTVTEFIRDLKRAA